MSGALRSVCFVETFNRLCVCVCLCVCVVIIEAHLLLWECADVKPLAAVWFDAERCVLFYHSQALLWKGGVTAPLKPEPSSDLFVDLWGGRRLTNNERFYLPSFFFPPSFYLHLVSTRGKVFFFFFFCGWRTSFCSRNLVIHMH